MLPILRRTTGSALARNLMGNKKNVKASTIAPKSQSTKQTQKKGNALVRVPGSAMAKPMPPIQKVAAGSASKGNYLESIHVNVLQIEKILKGTLAAEKEELRQKRKNQKAEDRANQEKKLEAKDEKQDKKGIKMPKVSQIGILGWIKRFIGNVILGIFFSKLVDFAPALVGFVKVADSVTTFLANAGITIVDGLATFVDWGYKAYDATKGFLANFGVQPQLFDQFAGALSGMIDALIIGSVILAARGGDGPGGFDGPTKGPRTRGNNGRPRVTQSGDRRLPGAPVTQGRGGQPRGPRIPGTGPRVTGSKPPGGIKFPKIPRVRTPKGLKGAGLIGLLLLIPTLFEVGGLMTQGYWKTGLNVAVSTLAGIAAASAATGTVIAGGLAASLTGIGLPAGIAAVLSSLVIGGAAGWAAYEASYNGLKALGLRDDDLKSQGYQEGGRVTKKTKVRRGIRTKKRLKKLTLKKPVRESLPPLPSSVEDGKTADEQKKNQRSWWDFLGWASSSERQPLGVGGEQLADKVTNVGNTLGENNFFGPILRVTSKIILGHDIDSVDYKNVGLGLNLLVNEGIKKEKVKQGLMGYADGGEVIKGNIAVDVESWVEDTFREAIKKDSTKSYLSGSKYTKRPQSEMGVEGSARGTLTSLGSGGGSLKDMSDQDFSDLAYIVSGEAARGTDDEYGVAAAVLNRVADPRYPNTIMGVGTAPGQFEAVYKGLAVRDEALAKKLKDNQGKIVEALKKLQGRTDFKGQSQLENKGDTDIMFDSRGNFYHYSEQIGKTDPVPSNIPQDWKKLLGPSTGQSFTAQSATGANLGPISSGTGGSYEKSGRGTKLAGDLGRYIYQTLNTPRDFSQASEHPDFGGSFRRSYRSWHNIDRAIDIGGYWPEDQVKILAKIEEFNRKNGVKPVELLYGKPGTPNAGTHGDHVHVAYEKGGMTLSRPHLALMGEKGTEIVIDADSSQFKPVANMLLAINQASDKQGVLNAINEYAPYDSRSDQVIIMEDEYDEGEEEMYGQSSGGILPVMSGSYDNSLDFLDYQG